MWHWSTMNSSFVPAPGGYTRIPGAAAIRNQSNIAPDQGRLPASVQDAKCCWNARPHASSSSAVYSMNWKLMGDHHISKRRGPVLMEHDAVAAGTAAHAGESADRRG